MKKYILFLLILSLTSLLIIGCFSSSKDDKDNNTTPNNTGTLKIGITDAPLDNAEEANILITKIQIKKETDENDNYGWITYFESTTGKSINLLEYRNGNVSLFDSKSFEEGTYHQIRLFLATTGNSIKINGETYPLKYNSGVSNNGIKLVNSFTITKGVETALTIDFDVRKSIVQKMGNSNKAGYYIKPTIRLISNNLSGKITVNALSPYSIYYLYSAGYDIKDEFKEQEITLPDSTTSTAIFLNAICSTQSELINDSLQAIFAFIPFGTYDIYKYDANEIYKLKLIAQNVTISSTNSSITIQEK